MTKYTIDPVAITSVKGTPFHRMMWFAFYTITEHTDTNATDQVRQKIKNVIDAAHYYDLDSKIIYHMTLSDFVLISDQLRKKLQLSDLQRKEYTLLFGECMQVLWEGGLIDGIPVLPWDQR